MTKLVDATICGVNPKNIPLMVELLEQIAKGELVKRRELPNTTRFLGKEVATEYVITPWYSSGFSVLAMEMAQEVLRDARGGAA